MGNTVWVGVPFAPVIIFYPHVAFNSLLKDSFNRLSARWVLTFGQSTITSQFPANRNVWRLVDVAHHSVWPGKKQENKNLKKFWFSLRINKTKRKNKFGTSTGVFLFVSQNSSEKSQSGFEVSYCALSLCSCRCAATRRFCLQSGEDLFLGGLRGHKTSQNKLGFGRVYVGRWLESVAERCHCLSFCARSCVCVCLCLCPGRK